MAIVTRKFKIRGGKNKRKYLDAAAKEVNFVWNYINETVEFAYRQRRESLSRFAMNSLLAGYTDENKDHRINSATITMIQKIFFEKRNEAFKQIKSGKKTSIGRSVLRFRSNKRSEPWIPFYYQNLKIKPDGVVYNKHKFKVFDSENLPEKFKDGCFVRHPNGDWYVCLTVEEPDRERVFGGKQVGIDLGIKSLATLSDGTIIEAPRIIQQYEDKLAKFQRDGKRKAVANLHEKISNVRKDFLHKLSKKIVDENDLIVVGSAPVKMMNRGFASKSSYDNGLGMFVDMLRYKSAMSGKTFLKVNEAYTTQTCSSCRTVPDSSPKGESGLDIREWVCSNCGASHNRDINAAVNILRIGQDTLGLK